MNALRLIALRRITLAGLSVGLLALVLTVAPARAGIELPEEYPLQGSQTEITVMRADGFPAAGTEVMAVYRPGSSVPDTMMVGVTAPNGKVTWTPEQAGLVALSAEVAANGSREAESLSQNLSVRYDGIPTGGLIIMILAGAILYGGIFRGFRSLH